MASGTPTGSVTSKVSIKDVRFSSSIGRLVIRADSLTYCSQDQFISIMIGLFALEPGFSAYHVSHPSWPRATTRCNPRSGAFSVGMELFEAAMVGFYELDRLSAVQCHLRWPWSTRKFQFRTHNELSPRSSAEAWRALLHRRCNARATSRKGVLWTYRLAIVGKFWFEDAALFDGCDCWSELGCEV